MKTENRDMIAGIDFSITGPAICLCDRNKPFSLKNCTIHYKTKVKKYAQSYKNIHGEFLDDFETNMEKFNHLAEWVMEVTSECSEVFIEGYAMGAKGMIFNIGEATGLVKWFLWNENVPCYSIAPGTIKKQFNGKGNATKDKMYETFVEETGVELVKLLDYNKSKIVSPVSDIVDAYAIAKLGYHTT